jgi:hypothetical protein
METERNTSVRELAGSFLSFGWAMSLFSANQLVNLLDPRKAESSFNAVTQVARDQVGEALRPAFQVGENLQRGAVDLMFRMVSLGTSSPMRFAKSSAAVVQKSASGLTQSLSTPASKGAQVPGWGPVD